MGKQSETQEIATKQWSKKGELYMNQMKKIIAIIILGLLLLSGCGNKSKNEVIFLNYPPYTISESVTYKMNSVESRYEQDRDEEMKYAFVIEFECYIDSENIAHTIYPSYSDDYLPKEKDKMRTEYLTKKIVEIVQETELMIIPDYPFCYYNQEDVMFTGNDPNDYIIGLCAVAGTMDQIEELFDWTEPIDGFCFQLWPAPRPDLLEKTKEAGWIEKEDRVYLMQWMNSNFDELRSVLGEENQVKWNVNFEESE